MNWVVVSLASPIFLAKFVMTAWSTSTASVIRSTWSKVYAIFFLAGGSEQFCFDKFRPLYIE